MQSYLSQMPNVSTQSFEIETIDIQSDTPPVPHIGFDTDLLDTELSAACLMANGLKVTDVIRIQINANHILEIVSSASEYGDRSSRRCNSI